MRNCKYYRLVKNLTQSEVSRLSGIPQQKISELERGNLVIAKYRLKKLAKVLEFPGEPIELLNIFQANAA